MNNLAPRRLYRALESRMARYAKEQGIPFERVRKRLAQMVTCGALSRAVSSGVLPMYFVKGGVALELRFGLLARLTKDIDIGLVAQPRKLVAALEAALALGYHDFTFQIVSLRELPNNTLRVELQLRYHGLAWAKLEVDLSPAAYDVPTESVAAVHLADFGLETFDIVCLSIEDQVAQKLHGATEPDRADYVNPRYRDIFDLLLIDQRLTLDYGRVRTACEAVFVVRAKQPWPPTDFAIPERWHPELERLVREQRLPYHGFAQLQAAFSAIVARILGVRTMAGYEYRFNSLDVAPQGPRDQFYSPVDAGAPDTEGLNNLAAEGWRIVGTCVNPRYSDARLIVILERALPG